MGGTDKLVNNSAKIISQRFLRARETYDTEAVVQKNVCEKLIKLLPVNHYKSILEIGCGTGMLSKEIFSHLNFDNICFNDLVPEMENNIKLFLPENMRFKFNFIPGNAEKLQFNEMFDLVISSSTFQWFDELKIFVHRISEKITNDGIFAFSTYGTDNLKEIRNITGKGLHYYEIEKIISMCEKFNILHTSEEKIELKFDKPEKILKHMKQTGVNSLSNEKWTKAKTNEFCEKYLDFKDADNFFKLTYNPIFVVAKKRN